MKQESTGQTAKLEAAKLEAAKLEAATPEESAQEESQGQGPTGPRSLSLKGENTPMEQPPGGFSLKSGTVALVGRPNAGKSTLMNQFLAEKLAIVSNKPQTTRQRLVGILGNDQGQMVFFDTPGVHKPQHRLNRRMLKAAQEALLEADLICLLHDVSQSFGGGDRFLLDWVSSVDTPKIAVLNKIDLVQKDSLLPRIATFAKTGAFREIVPISARKGDGAELLLDLLFKLLPVGPPLFEDADLLTTHPERFLVAERIREKVLIQTRDELPFATAVVIDAWNERQDKDLVEIHASILAERNSQKKILVGRAGRQIKALGIAARADLEEFLGRHVFLDLRVRVEADWRENRRFLDQLDRSTLATFDQG